MTGRSLLGHESLPAPRCSRSSRPLACRVGRWSLPWWSSWRTPRAPRCTGWSPGRHSEGAPSPRLEHRLPLLLDTRLTVEPGRPVCYFAAP